MTHPNPEKPMTDFRKCTTPGAIYEFSIAGNVFSAKVTCPTLRGLTVSDDDFDRIVHDALEDLINRISVDTGKTSSSHWARRSSKLEDHLP